VHRHALLGLTVEDLRHLSPAQQDTWLAEWLKSESDNKFDWGRPPLVRFHIHRRTDRTFQFTLSEPFFDGWSVASLLTELFFATSLISMAGPLPLDPPLASSYRTFVALRTCGARIGRIPAVLGQNTRRPSRHQNTSLVIPARRGEFAARILSQYCWDSSIRAPHVSSATKVR